MLIEISHYIYAKFLTHTRENELLRIIKKIQILFLIGIIFISGSVSQSTSLTTLATSATTGASSTALSSQQKAPPFLCVNYIIAT